MSGKVVTLKRAEKEKKKSLDGFQWSTGNYKAPPCSLLSLFFT